MLKEECLKIINDRFREIQVKISELKFPSDTFSIYQKQAMVLSQLRQIILGAPINTARPISEIIEEALDEPPLVTVDDGFVVVNKNIPYEIGLEQIKTPEQLLGWVVQLAPKNWVTTKLLEMFVLVVSGEKGWKIHDL